MNISLISSSIDFCSAIGSVQCLKDISYTVKMWLVARSVEKDVVQHAMKVDVQESHSLKLSQCS